MLENNALSWYNLYPLHLDAVTAEPGEAIGYKC